MVNNLEVSPELFMTESENSFYISTKKGNYRLSKEHKKTIYKIVSEIKGKNNVEKNEYIDFLLSIEAIYLAEEIRPINNETISVFIGNKEFVAYINRMDRFSDFNITSNLKDADWNFHIYDDRLILSKYPFPYEDSYSLTYYLYCLEVFRGKLRDQDFLNHLDKEAILEVNLEDFLNPFVRVPKTELWGDNLENTILFRSWFSKINFDYDSFYPYIKAKYSNILGDNVISFGKSTDQVYQNIVYLLYSKEQYTEYITKKKVEMRTKENDTENIPLFKELFSIYSKGKKLKMEDNGGSYIFFVDENVYEEYTSSLFLTNYFKNEG